MTQATTGSPQAKRLRQSRAGDADEAAEFIHETLGQLTLIAHKHRHSVLAHLLEMARMEAASTIDSRRLAAPSVAAE